MLNSFFFCITSASVLIGDSIDDEKFSHSLHEKKDEKKSRMQNKGVINKGMKNSVSRSHTTSDHNNKRNNAMDCHPHVKKKM